MKAGGGVYFILWAEVRTICKLLHNPRASCMNGARKGNETQTNVSDLCSPDFLDQCLAKASGQAMKLSVNGCRVNGGGDGCGVHTNREGLRRESKET